MGCDYYIVTEARFVNKDGEEIYVEIDRERGYFFDDEYDPDTSSYKEHRKRLRERMNSHNKKVYAMQEGKWIVPEECRENWEMYLRMANRNCGQEMNMENIVTIYKTTYCYER